jgi:membrane fusion protein (multidrug efflux system)
MLKYLCTCLLMALPLSVEASTQDNFANYPSLDALTSTLNVPVNVHNDITCLIEPSMVVNLGSPAEGVIEEIVVDRSDSVRVGQVIARLHRSVEVADIAYQSTKADYGKRKTLRSQDLRRKQLISEQDLDDLVTEQLLAEQELKQKQELLSLKVIKSPVNGVVVDRYKNPGDLVAGEKIVRIARIHPLYAELVLPSTMFGRINKDDVYPVIPQLSSDVLEGRVVAVDKVIDPASGTFRVRLAVANRDYKQPSGQRCRVDFSSMSNKHK